MTAHRRLRVCVRGVARGVGFRRFVDTTAARAWPCGSVSNDSSGATIDFTESLRYQQFLVCLHDRPAAAGDRRIR